MLVRLVDARNRRGDAVATAVRLSTEADVARKVVGVGTGNAVSGITRAVVAVRARRDELNAAEQGRGVSDRRGGRGVREHNSATHITENRGARGAAET